MKFTVPSRNLCIVLRPTRSVSFDIESLFTSLVLLLPGIEDNGLLTGKQGT